MLPKEIVKGHPVVLRQRTSPLADARHFNFMKVNTLKCGDESTSRPPILPNHFGGAFYHTLCRERGTNARIHSFDVSIERSLIRAS